MMTSRAWRLVLVMALAAAVPAAACKQPAPVPPPDEAAGQSVLPEPGQLPEAGRTVIAVLGDSLTAGLGLALTDSYPSRLQEMFANEGYDTVEIANAGLSGDTTAGGLRRLPSVLAPNVQILVVALGGNDALRGLGLEQTHDNLARIIDAGLQAGARVVLAGMESPTNLGKDYQDGFHNVYVRLARDYQGRITFIPFLLEGVAGNPSLNQADGIHPNEQGARMVAEHLYPALRDLVDQVSVHPVS
jgi:acyl-CoA thioesterase-1